MAAGHWLGRAGAGRDLLSVGTAGQRHRRRAAHHCHHPARGHSYVDCVERAKTQLAFSSRRCGGCGRRGGYGADDPGCVSHFR